MRIKNIVFVLGFIMTVGCQEAKNISVPMPEPSASLIDEHDLLEDVLYDKVLGSLVGSAIGDAMGASTEMWHRTDIQRQYGYITGLTDATRVKSPEGTWRENMIAGATTDDTRWKYLVGRYMNEYRGGLDADNFSNYIIDYYQSLLDGMGADRVKESADLLEEQMEQVDWIKEWARVALAFQNGSSHYNRAQARFYGGEMSCAGMLYTSMFGLLVSEPTAAYEAAFDHALFDIGYAKDISGLTAAMTNMAMRTASMDSIINVIQFVDPYNYKDSRLIGRIAGQLLASAQAMVAEGNALSSPVDELAVPTNYNGSILEWSQLQTIYNKLEGDQRAIAFHAGEIFQILIAGMEYGEGDFLKSMQFIVNYGRDNDTVAAVAGMILGAKDGFSNLPVGLRSEILRVNKEVIGIDLEVLAKQIVAK